MARTIPDLPLQVKDSFCGNSSRVGAGTRSDCLCSRKLGKELLSRTLMVSQFTSYLLLLS